MMPMSRQTDANRNTPFYEGLILQGQNEGILADEPLPVDVLSYFNTLKSDPNRDGVLHQLIGDDLSKADLDNLWATLSGSDPDPDSLIPSWWADKPHQLAYRLILRLTRAEAQLADRAHRGK